MKKVILFGYLFWAVLVALFIITLPEGINSLGWAIYGGGFLLGFFLLITTITLIYYSTKYKTVKIISLILGFIFCSAVFWFYIGKDTIENYKNGIYATKMPDKYMYWYDYLWHINDDHFYSDLSPKKELEFDEQKEYMINGSSNIFFCSKNELFTYYYNSLDNLLFFVKISPKGTSEERLTHTKTKKTEQKGVFLGNYYIDFDENYYHTWLVDNDTLKKPLEEIPHTEKWTTEQKRTFLSKIQKEATYYFLKHTDRKDYYDLKEFPEEGNYKVVFLLEGKWQLAQLYCQREDFATLEPARGTHPPFRQALMERFTAPPIYAPAKNLRPVYIHKSSIYSPDEDDRKNTDPQFDNNHLVEVYFDISQGDRMAYLKTTYLMPKDYQKFLHAPSTFLKKEDEEMEIFYREALYRQKQCEYAIYFNGNEVYLLIERYVQYLR